MLIQSAPPVHDRFTHTLIMGVIASGQNRDRTYYDSEMNQFWHIMGRVIGANLASRPYQDRLSILTRQGFGIWDVVASAERLGPQDIRVVETNDLQAFLLANRNVRTIAFNGKRPAEIAHKATPNLRAIAQTFVLPSSSSKFSMSLSRKSDMWSAMLNHEMHPWAAAG